MQVWEVYAGLAASLTQRLQMLQSDVTSALSGTPGQDDNAAVEQVAVKIHKVQVGNKVTPVLKHVRVVSPLPVTRLCFFTC